MHLRFDGFIHLVTVDVAMTQPNGNDKLVYNKQTPTAVFEWKWSDSFFSAVYLNDGRVCRAISRHVISDPNEWIDWW